MTHKRPTFEYEDILWNSGYSLVCGVDEVGRGAFAGPVVASAVIFPPKITFSNKVLSEIHDSKLLTPKKRKILSEAIQNEALSFSIAEVGVPVINKIGIGKASQLAFQKAVVGLLKVPDFCLTDAFGIETISASRQRALIKGDRLSISIAAASIIAKVYRDTLMETLHDAYSVYNFKQNKGYGTLLHRKMLALHGLTPLHRTSFNIRPTL